ncbi:MAG: hypothetical protein Q8S57_03930 [Methanoregula sp.]|nr:hypothetical protein [Methanoregula sp.]
MTATLTAYIDMEFAGIYGTHQRMQIPIEIGVVLHDPKTDALSFAGKPFQADVEVELWKNILNNVGKRVDSRRRVFNLADTSRTQQFDHRFHLSPDGARKARTAIAAANADLRLFMQALNRRNIGTLVFFARQREMVAFRQARVRTDGFLTRDIQHEIAHAMQLKEQISLDRMSLIIGFGITSTTIKSAHLSYTIPPQFQYVIKPHKAIGDAARMFLVDMEFKKFQNETSAGIKDHILQYEKAREDARIQREAEPGAVLDERDPDMP